MLVHRAGLLVCLIIPRTDTSRLQPTKHRSAKHIPSRKKLRRARRRWSAKRYYHSLGVLCNQRLICPRPALPDKFVHHSRTIDKLTNSNSVSGARHYRGMTRALFKICHSDYLLVCLCVTPALSYPPVLILSNYSALFCLRSWHH